MPGTMLELDRIDTYRGPAQILRGVSLAVDDGEAVCLVGRNGAGKTTTIDSIMGLLPVRVGKVALRGRDITHLPAHERALLGIGYAPEDAGIFPDLTVEENFQITSWLARPDAAWGPSLRRPEEDGRDQSRADAPALGPAPRRAVRGAGARGRHPPHRGGQGDQGARHLRADRRVQPRERDARRRPPLRDRPR